jgi:uncharacterized membrane protein YdfJ with MMPL/SSD domain
MSLVTLGARLTDVSAPSRTVAAMVGIGSASNYALLIVSAAPDRAAAGR